MWHSQNFYYNVYSLQYKVSFWSLLNFLLYSTRSAAYENMTVSDKCIFRETVCENMTVSDKYIFRENVCGEYGGLR